MDQEEQEKHPGTEVVVPGRVFTSSVNRGSFLGSCVGEGEGRDQ